MLHVGRIFLSTLANRRPSVTRGWPGLVWGRTSVASDPPARCEPYARLDPIFDIASAEPIPLLSPLLCLQLYIKRLKGTVPSLSRFLNQLYQDQKITTLGWKVGSSQ